jgi:hypothetical protein
MSEFLMNDGRPSGWTEEEWNDFEEYMECLSDEEYELEMKWLESLAQVKMQGKEISTIQTNYLM